MKRWHSIFGRTVAALLLCALCPTLSAAQADTAALQQLVQSYEKAIRSGDVSKSGIRASLTKDFSAAMPSGQAIASYADLGKAENALRTMVGRGTVYDTVEATLDGAPDVSGDLAAFSGHTLNHATAQGGKSRSFTTHWTAVARREGGQWKLARHQAVMDPSTNPWNHESGGPGWGLLAIAALGCGVAGLVVGIILARVIPRGGSTATAGRPTPGDKARAWDKPGADSSAPEAPHSAPAAGPAPAPTRQRAWDKPSETDAAASASDPPPGEGRKSKRAWES